MKIEKIGFVKIKTTNKNRSRNVVHMLHVL